MFVLAVVLPARRNYAYENNSRIGSSWTERLRSFSGQIQGALFVGNLSICTNEKLVSDCAYPAISEVPLAS